MKAGRKTKQIIRDLMACKVEGICENTKIVNDWFRRRVESNDAIRLTVNEAMREAMELPVCPPVCPALIEDEVVS